MNQTVQQRKFKYAILTQYDSSYCLESVTLPAGAYSELWHDLTCRILHLVSGMDTRFKYKSSLHSSHSPRTRECCALSTIKMQDKNKNRH